MCLLVLDIYYANQLSRALRKFGLVQLVLLSRATGSVSSGNLSAFDVVGSKSHEIAGDDIVTIGNKECFSCSTVISSPKLLRRALLN